MDYIIEILNRQSIMIHAGRLTYSIHKTCRQHVNPEMLTENENPFFLTR